ncbi:MAG: hypothetical protein QXG97_03630 [Nitrososphaerota archaeon]
MGRKKKIVTDSSVDYQNISLEELLQQLDKVTQQYDAIIEKIRSSGDDKEVLDVCKVELNVLKSKQAFIQKAIDQLHKQRLTAISTGHLIIEIVDSTGATRSKRLLLEKGGKI